MKTAVSTYSFCEAISKGELTEFGTFQKAKDMGFDGIEVAMFKVPEGMTEEEYAKELRKESERLDLPIVNYCFSADFINGSSGNFDAEVERVKHYIDIAELMGTKSVRHDSAYSVGNFRSFDKALPQMARGCRIITEYAEKKGIRTMIENHGYFCQESERVEKLYNAVDHDNFGLLVDMGNFTCADEMPTKAVGKLASYAKHVHAKDFYIKKASTPSLGRGFIKSRNGSYLKGTIIGHGDVDVMACLCALKASGYDGYVSIEFEGMEENIKALEIGLENIKYYLSLIG